MDWEEAFDAFESLYRARDEMQSALISARRVLRKATASEYYWAEAAYAAAESLLTQDEDERLQDVIDALDDLWTELKDG